MNDSTFAKLREARLREASKRLELHPFCSLRQAPSARMLSAGMADRRALPPADHDKARGGQRQHEHNTPCFAGQC